MHVLIFANGIITDYAVCPSYLHNAELIICANGGTIHTRQLGIVPNVIIGDLDSLDIAERYRLKEPNTELIQHPAHKDETDLELALLYAVERGATEITIFGALGGRIDQTLANCYLLAMKELHGIHVKIVEAAQEIRLLHAPCTTTFKGHVDDIISLLPLTPEVRGIFTDGLAYPLRGGTLHLGAARGVSNALAAPIATVRVGEGLLLAVHISK